jgi:hypothetical protein
MRDIGTLVDKGLRVSGPGIGQAGLSGVTPKFQKVQKFNVTVFEADTRP